MEMNTTKRPLGERLWEITYSYFPLSFTTFGGPSANIAIIFRMFVTERHWLTEEIFAELFSIAQALPGPPSTQLAFALAMIREGVIPAIWSFFVWSGPGAIVMLAVALGVSLGGTSSIPDAVIGLENGLVSSAIGLTALAAFQLGKKFSTDTTARVQILISGGLAIAYYSNAWLFPCLIIFGGIVTYTQSLLEPKWKQYQEALRRKRIPTVITDPKKNDDSESIVSRDVDVVVGVAVTDVTDSINEESMADATERLVDEEFAVKFEPNMQFTYSWGVGLLLLGVWVLFLVLAIVFRYATNIQTLNLLGTFYFTGSIIFGGGPVVIPLLQSYVVSPGWLTDREYLIGLAVINALPGPLFNFSAYCGALALRSTVGTSIGGGMLAYVGICAPGLILMSALLPIWRRLRSLQTLQILFKGMNSSAVGLVFAAVYLLWNKAISGRSKGTAVGSYPIYTILVAFAFVAAGYTKIPPPILIIIGGAVGVMDWAVNANDFVTT
ncbi:hypothetical protein SmJEL517_g03679 [Synchytrium microbalum]|uniref:Chromate transporter n=1 Tax=Synchytrium microbalum TaxID=1806994 RepID=A0A507C184_9FUNG|nr:uncharacterized protein SmJEL517_g03679 [Synchytrium microbalum]TPX33462.1 hypothetical protein SmJEL517_g03679 [Synchytrium microbalum]